MPHLLPSGPLPRSVIDEELGLLGDGLLGGFSNEGVDENVDYLQGRIPERHENQDFWTDKSRISQLEIGWIESRVGNTFG